MRATRDLPNLDFDPGLATEIKKQIKKPEGKVIERKKEDAEKCLEVCEDILAYLDGPESYDAETLLKISEGLQKKDYGILDGDMPEEVAKASTELAEMNSDKVNRTIHSFDKKAEEAGVSREVFLEELRKSEVEKNIKLADGVQQYLEAKQEIDEWLEGIRPRLLEIVGGQFGQLRDNAKKETDMAEGELNEFNAQFEVKEPAQDYETLARGYKEQFVSEKTAHYNRDWELRQLPAQIEKIKKAIDGGYMIDLASIDDRGNLNEQYSLQTSGRDERAKKVLELYEKKLEKLERIKGVQAFIWADFFSEFKSFLDQECGDDEAKKTDWLNRVADTNKEGTGIIDSRRFAAGSEYNISRDLVSEFGNSAKLIIDKYLQARLLSSLETDPNKLSEGNAINQFSAKEYYSFMAQVETRDLDEIQSKLKRGERVEFGELNGQMFDNLQAHGISGDSLVAYRDMNKKAEELLQNNPQLLSKIESVFKIVNGVQGSEHSNKVYRISPVHSQHGQGYRNFLVLHGGAETLKLQMRDGVFYNEGKDYQAQEAERNRFEQGISNTISASKEPGAKVILTREDAIRDAQSQAERARQNALRSGVEAKQKVTGARAEVQVAGEREAEAKKGKAELARENEALKAQNAVYEQLVTELSGKVDGLKNDLTQTKTASVGSESNLKTKLDGLSASLATEKTEKEKTLKALQDKLALIKKLAAEPPTKTTGMFKKTEEVDVEALLEELKKLV